MKPVILALLFSITAFAHSKFIPSSIPYNGNKAVFLDFKSAEYNLNFDGNKIKINTTLKIEQFEDGYPIIDLVPTITNYKITKNNKVICDKSGNTIHEIPLMTMNVYELDRSNVIGLDCILPVGSHTLKIEHEINNKNELGFWYTDRYPRDLLEKYLPTNLEFDQYTSKINLFNLPKNLEVISNGTKVRLTNSISVTYPDYFNSSSIYLHIIDTKDYSIKIDFFKSNIDKKKSIKIIAYHKSPKDNLFLNNSKIIKNTKKHLQILESMFGSWPHKEIKIFQDRLVGGMEYPGAMYTSSLYLGHELFHNYFARGVFPNNGNAGWIDEGLAVWYDLKQFHKRSTLWTYKAQDRKAMKELQNVIPNIGNINPYNRTTHKASYTRGYKFFKAIDKQSNGKLDVFLKYFYNRYKYQIYSEDIFIQELKSHYNYINTTQLLDKYIYKKSN